MRGSQSATPYPLRNPGSIFQISQHSRFYTGLLMVPSTRITYLFLKYVTSISVTWCEPSDQDGRKNDLILQLIWLFQEERLWLCYISWQNRDKNRPENNSSKRLRCMKILEHRICFSRVPWRRYLMTRRPRNHIINSWRKHARWR